MNSLFVLFDLLITATPIRLLHFYQPMVYLAIYALFSVIFYLAGGMTASGSHYIYPVLNWGKVGPTLAFMGVGVVASLLLHVSVMTSQ